MPMQDIHLQQQQAQQHMHEMQPGKYGVLPDKHMSVYEDESTCHGLVCKRGIIVSRIENSEVFVREWRVKSEFAGRSAYELFEEARERHAFDYLFSPERRLRQDDELNGADPVLRQQLFAQLLRRH